MKRCGWNWILRLCKRWINTLDCQPDTTYRQFWNRCGCALSDVVLIYTELVFATGTYYMWHCRGFFFKPLYVEMGRNKAYFIFNLNLFIHENYRGYGNWKKNVSTYATLLKLSLLFRFAKCWWSLFSARESKNWHWNKNNFRIFLWFFISTENLKKCWWKKSEWNWKTKYKSFDCSFKLILYIRFKPKPHVHRSYSRAVLTENEKKMQFCIQNWWKFFNISEFFKNSPYEIS